MHKLILCLTVVLLARTGEAAAAAAAAGLTFPEATSPANQIAPVGYTPIPTPGPEAFELQKRGLSNICGFNNGQAGVTCAPNYYCTTSSAYFGCCRINDSGAFNCSLYTACVDYNDISGACPGGACSYPLTNCPSSAPSCATFLITTSSDTFNLAYSNFICSTSATILYYSPTVEATTQVQTSVQTTVQTTVQTSVDTVTTTPTPSSSSPTSYTIVGTSTLTFTSSTPAPSTIVVAPSSSTAATAAGASASSTTSGTAPVQKSTSSSHTGAIAGGVVGGVVGLALIAGLIGFILYRMKKKREEAAWDNAPEMTGNTYPT